MALLLASFATPLQHSSDQNNCVVRIVNGEPTAVCSDSGSSGGGSGGGSGGPSETYVTVVVTGTGPDGQPCVGTARVPLSQAYGGGRTVEEVAGITGVRAVELGSLGMLPCPGADPVVFTPAMWALSYVRSIPLPVPAPQVDPGRMLVGLEAFLETGSPLTHVVAEPGTPFGPATFTFTSTVTVDWGDGTTTGPVETTGGPYPDGDLRHVYTSQGAYDIVVTQDWTATWHIGAESGTVEGLQTTGTLAGFPVEEREAVVVG